MRWGDWNWKNRELHTGTGHNKEYLKAIAKRDMEKTTRHNAIGKCKCGKYVISTGGGRFARCKCGESYIDQEGWSGLYIRLGGDIELVEHICPESCEYRNNKEGDSFDHSNNKQINDFEELKEYMKENYQFTVK